MSFEQEYLGRGWTFPFGFDSATGGVATSVGEDNIRQCIAVILATKPGERQMLPKFGCRIHEMLFAPNTAATAAMIEHYVREALERWEPRIEVVEVQAVPRANGQINVVLDYVVNATRARAQFMHVLSTSNR